MNVWQQRLLAAACATTVAGCAQSMQNSGTVVPPQVPEARSAGWMSAEVKTAKALLYVADPTGAPSYSGVIDVFALHGLKYTLIGQIPDVDNPQGMTTDASGNLYVADIGVATEGPAVGDIKVFPKGSTVYSREIVPAKWVPVDIAVGRDGTIYAANIAPIGYFSPGSVSVFPPSASQASRVLRFKNDQVYGITLHGRSRTIYVSYGKIGSSNDGAINEFVRARGKPKNLGVSYSEPWGILEDGNDNLLALSGSGTINVYAESNGQLVQQISVPNGAMFEAFDESRSKIFVTNFQEVEILSYPRGKLLGNVDQSGWGGRSDYPTGVAYWPPPQ